jgi:hypothetical protein
LKQTKKQKNTTAPSTAPQSLGWFFSNPKSEEEGGGGGGGGGDKRGKDDEEGELELEGDTAVKGTILAGVLLVGVVGGFAAVGYVYKDQMSAFLNQFSTFIEGNGNLKKKKKKCTLLKYFSNLGWILLVCVVIVNVGFSECSHPFVWILLIGYWNSIPFSGFMKIWHGFC